MQSGAPERQATVPQRDPRWLGLRSAATRAGEVTLALAAGVVLSDYVGLVLPAGGARWAVGAGTLLWACLACALLALHALRWYVLRRGARSGARGRGQER